MEIDELVSEQDWATVVVLGTYEELIDTPHYRAGRERAHELLRKRPMWWEPACVTTIAHEKERPAELTYFRIHIDKVSGRRGVPETDGEFAVRRTGPQNWLRRILKRPEQGRSVTIGAHDSRSA